MPDVNAQQTQYTNMQEGGSVELPIGVTADYRLETSAHLAFRPNPVGVGQSVLINTWLTPGLHESRYFSGYLITITKPDGTNETIEKDSYRADSTTWAIFTPDKAGSYKIKFDFPGGYFPAGNYTIYEGAWPGAQVTNFQQSVYYEPSSDGPYELIVQEQSVDSWPPAALPTDYWTRPVNPENREWWPVLGYYPSTGIVGNADDNWPADTNTYMSSYQYTPYVQAPETAHIVWKKETAIGGLIGGPLKDISWTSSSAASIIYAGRCYQTVSKPGGENVLQCYDLRNGEVFWEIPVEAGAAGFFGPSYTAPSMVTFWEGYPEVPGGAPQFGRNLFLTYVGGGRLINFNPYTGAIVHNVSIAPLTSGTLYANFDFPYFLSVQNIGNTTNPQYRLVNWTVKADVGPYLQLVNLGLRVMNNITWPFSSLGVVDYEAGVAVLHSALRSTAAQISEDAVIGAADIYTGELLWNKTADIHYTIWPSEQIADHGKFATRFSDGYFYCFDLRSGTQLWKSEISSWPWGTFGGYGISSYGGNIIVGQYDGVVAYDWETGKVSWFYQAKANYPLETYYEDVYPFFTGTIRIADNKVYIQNSEHTATQPITRGWKMYCIDATTGEEYWNITGSMTPSAVAEGYLTAANTADGYMYVFGKGQSQTTVSAPNVVIPIGNSVVIQGTVTDQSPGQKGTPAISDIHMTEWMEYLHMQKQFPTNAIGVPVKLTAIAPDGSIVDIGIVNSDNGGSFAASFTPTMEGKYQITATFEGTKSYGSSYATTNVIIGTEQSTIQTPTTTSTPITSSTPITTLSPTISPSAVVGPTSDTTTTLYIAIAAAIIIIAIVAAAFFLRKQK